MRLLAHGLARILLASPAAILAPAAAQTAVAPQTAGRYVHSEMEMISEIDLLPDGRFRYGLTVGDLDERAQGRWSVDGDRVRLASEPRPKPPSITAGPARLDPNARLKVKVVLPDGRMVGDVDLTVGFETGDPISEPVGVDRSSADGAISPTPTQSWTMPPGERRKPRWIELGSQGNDAMSIPAIRFPIDPAKANDLTFILNPNDIGVVDLTDVPVELVPGGLLVHRGGGAGVLYRRVGDAPAPARAR